MEIPSKKRTAGVLLLPSDNYFFLTEVAIVGLAHVQSWGVILRNFAGEVAIMKIPPPPFIIILSRNEG